ncbi:UMTA methyltransferase family protein [Macrophomina phaseolina]|uniref:UMTA methyltransferase family protein n=1 Tax=Macrophomina phaseolina TaxID=35725 RepID=A0ABQ8FVM8_9PEZI|nr:UMTA methyltransferase family protein [Macrophomina phaseolina]
MAASDSDSTYETDPALSELSASVTSSILNGKFENGRRYHAHREGLYFLPEDEKEQDRLGLMGHCFTLAMDGELYRAPLRDPKLCLDIGTGTGVWALDLADKYPDCQVIGTDLSPIQPHWTAPNCKFIVDDANADWVFSEKGQFDLIHARYIYAGVEDWGKLWRQAYEHLRPGGWVESHEPTAMFYTDKADFDKEKSQAWYWVNKVDEATKKVGRWFNVAHLHDEELRKAGFVNVHQECIHVPIGTWDKNKTEIGKVAMLNVLEAVRPTCLAVFTRVLGWDLVQSEALSAAVVKEFLHSKEQQLYFKLYLTWGQKPLDAQ